MLTKNQHTALKAKLTRAQNSGDPLKVLAATDEAFATFDTDGYPDTWHTWRMAEYDALGEVTRRHARR